jgi:hypothetical protein
MGFCLLTEKLSPGYTLAKFGGMMVAIGGSQAWVRVADTRELDRLLSSTARGSACKGEIFVSPFFLVPMSRFSSSFGAVFHCRELRCLESFELRL